MLNRMLTIEIARVTEAAAIAAARWRGRGDEKRADQAAVDAMRQALNAIVEMDGLHPAGLFPAQEFDQGIHRAAHGVDASGPDGARNSGLRAIPNRGPACTCPGGPV